MSTSPTQLSLKNIRERGYEPWVVEYYNAFSRKRVDLWGCFDLIGAGDDFIFVQTTSYSNTSSRVKKITDSHILPILRSLDSTIEVHGWRKVKNRWKVRIIDLS